MESSGTSKGAENPIDDVETQLMLRFASGDQKAYVELVELCQAGVIQYFVYLTRNRATAEDLAQEVLIRIFQAGKGYQPKARFRTYLFRIARNLWIDHCRREQHSAKNVSLDAADENGNGLRGTLAAAEPAGSSANASAERDLIHRAIEQLPVEQREVVLMSQIQGLLYEEVAEALEIPVGTVKSRMFHALRRLREILERTMK
ncbi:MAG TPA: sigma-70 family RNA polymerase sigma factor [Planctomycetota bacterium]|nr:sigma-70 family RNA polymerase sigma factor [Planctomycetota bacterium]